MNEKEIRGDGRIPSILIEAENLAEATHKAIVACHDYGARVETPKQRDGMSLGYDADITINVKNPLSEPRICYPGIYDDDRGVMQYILEVTHGIHNHWIKDPNNKEDTNWGYTYNDRFVGQIPFVLARIKKDWDEKRRITGRDYNFAIVKPKDDIILEQPDPACWQRGNLRFVTDKDGNIVMNYITDWRSRDLLKAWNENNLAQTELMNLFARKVSNMLGVDIKLGAYIDRSSSLHLYGLYVDRDNLEKQIENMKRDGYEKRSASLDDYLGNRQLLKRIVAAQLDAEKKFRVKNMGTQNLEKQGYNIQTFPYPADWDTWPKEWDLAPDRSKLM